MNRFPLNSLSKKISSGLTPLRSNPRFWDSKEIPWVKTEQLGVKHIYDSNEKVSSLVLEETGLKLNPINTISIAMYGEGRTRGSVSILKQKMTTNQACCNIVIDPEKSDYEYVYYFLKTQYKQLRSLSSGVRKNLNSNDIKNFEIALPKSIHEQKNIAKVLSDLDSKIEINNKINKELESMAKLIYEYWFVQFDFPISEEQAAAMGKPELKGKPYKVSGGKMEFNKELKREIPEGWEVQELGSYAKVKKGKLITAKTANLDGGVKVVSAGISYSYFHSESNYKANTITVSASGANAGFINYWREPIFACDCTTIRGFSDEDTLQLLGFLKMRQDYLYKQARGSAQPHVYPKDIEGLKIAVAPPDVITKFGILVNPGNGKISNNLKENQKLSELRDWLLPMLMNGQVTVGEAEDYVKKGEVGLAAEGSVNYKSR